jgi:hypothetical protein
MDEKNKEADSTVENTGENSGKMFTQSELDEIITKRLQREKNSVVSVTKQFETEIDGLTKQIESYQTIINSMLADEIKGFDESIQELLSKLSVEEKIAWLAKHKDGVQRKSIPVTPKPGDNNLNAIPSKKQKLF